MTQQKSGIAFHCHHDTLFEYVYDFDERVEYIKHNKPESEQKLRLRLFKLIPPDLLPEGFNKAWADYDKARADLDKAWADWDKARADYNKASEDYDKARADHDKAWADWDKAKADYNKAWADWESYILELHKKLCPDCPWDGKTIFPKKERK